MATRDMTSIAASEPAAKTIISTTEMPFRTRRALQNFLVVWLDANIDASKIYFKNSLASLRRVVASVNTFVNAVECMNFLKEFKKEKILIIVSGSLGREYVPQIHQWPQLDSIYVFCTNSAIHEHWVKSISKVKGIYTDIKKLCEALEIGSERCDRALSSLSFDSKDALFMYAQFFKEILLETADDDAKSIKEFVDYCRLQGDFAKEDIDKFEQEYSRHKPIWWYTAPYFIRTMLNRGLQLLDVNILLKMNFFIRHLHRDIDQIYSEKQQSYATMAPFKVYRGQGLSIKDFETMKKTKGELMSFNNFLLTSRNHHSALNDFVYPSIADPNLVGILFVMTIDPTRCTASSTPFVDIKNVGYGEDKDEGILFSTHTVFRIDRIKPINGDQTDRLWRINLTFTGNNDNELNTLMAQTRMELSSNTIGWSRLGYILEKMEQFEKAKQLYYILLEKTSSNKDLANYNYQLGLIYENMGKYTKALSLHEKALDMKKKSLHSDKSDLAQSYNKIGEVYYKTSEYSKAASYYEQAIDIKKKYLPPNHPDLVTSYNCLGNVYNKMKDYSNALSSYQKTLDIYEKTLPPYHLNFASSYTSIGELYCCTCNYPMALSFFEKVHEIYRKTLSRTDLRITQSKKDIERVKEKI